MSSSNGAGFLQAAGQLLEGYGQLQASKFEAKQLRQQGRSIVSDATRDVQEQRRQGDLVAGNTRAISAGQGGAMDAGMIERLARIHAENDVNVQSILYGARVQSDAANAAARQRKKEGRLAMLSSGIQAATSLANTAPKAQGAG